MKILYYFRDIDSMMFQWQKYHIVDELSHHNVCIDIVSPTAYESIEQANEAIVKRLQSGQYSLFLTCLNDQYINKETLYTIHKMGIPTVLFCPDNLVAPFAHKSVAPLFDLVWLTSKETEYLFKKWGCKTVFLPYAANPFFLIPAHSEEEIHRVGFIGTPHGSRIDRINYLLKNNVPITIHTNNNNLSNKFIRASLLDYYKLFYNYSKYPIGRRLAVAAVIDKFAKRELHDVHNCLERKDAVPLDNLAVVNGKYDLVLSFTDANSSGVLKNPVKIVNLRNFEIPMSGGIQFTLYSDELASYFENDKEIVMGKTMEECVEKAQFYLSDRNTQLRNKIRNAARARAEKQHTWFHRFQVIFDYLGIDYN